MLCRVAGAVYDVLGYVRPLMTASHDGMMFSTPLVDNDILLGNNCAGSLGGGWWFATCSL